MSTTPPPPQGPPSPGPYGQFVPGGQHPPQFPHGAGWQQVMPMPAGVRAARITAFVLAGLCLVGTVLAGVLGGPRVAGAVFSGGMLNLVVGILACRYHSAGNGSRIASIVLAALQILVAVGSIARSAGAGLVPLVGAIALVGLLSQPSAKAWFTRPIRSAQSPGVGPV